MPKSTRGAGDKRWNFRRQRRNELSPNVLYVSVCDIFPLFLRVKALVYSTLFSYLMVLIPALASFA